MEKYEEIAGKRFEGITLAEMMNVRGGDGDGSGVVIIPPPPPPPPYPGGGG